MTAPPVQPLDLDAAAHGDVVVAILLAGAVLLASYAFMGKGALLRWRLLYAIARGGALALLGLALMRPERSEAVTLTRKRALAILLDASRSMALPAEGRQRPRTRRDVLADLLRRHSADLGRLRERYDLRVYGFDREARRMALPDAEPAGDWPAPEAAGPATALGEAILAAVDDARGCRPAGVLVVSDGVSNLGTSLDDAAAELARAGVRAHAISLGDASAVADLAIETIEAPPLAALGRKFTVVARATARNVPALRATVVLRAGGRQVLRREVAFRGTSSEYVRASVVADEPGTLVVDAEVEAFPGEPVTTNNRRVEFVRIEDSTLRVLYVEGMLRQDFRAIRRALGGFGGMDLDVVRAFVRPGTGEGAKTPEIERVRWDEYDVFVLGELDAEALSPAQAANVVRLVEQQARGVVVLSGPKALAAGNVARLVPAEVSAEAAPASKVRLTREGIGHPALRVAESDPDAAAVWPRLGGIGDRAVAVRLRSTTQALVEAEDGTPLAIAGAAGSGRAAAILSGKTHVWADDPASPAGAYDRLVRSLVAWAAGRETPRGVLSVELSRHRLTPGDLASVTVRVNRSRAREAGLTDAEIDSLVLRAEVTGPLGTDGKDEVVAVLRLEKGPGGHAGSLRAVGTTGAAGIHRLIARPERADERIAPAETVFGVAGGDREFDLLEAAPGALKRLASATGGVYATAAQADGVFRELDRGETGVSVDVLMRTGLWDTWWVWLLFTLALVAEWWMRRP